MAVVKNGKKVVVGTQEGILNIWSWNRWADLSDRFPGHPNSIDAMIKIDEDVICTGSSDGIIRIVNIHPNKLLGIVGEHEDWPVERIRCSRDKKILGTCSHDNMLKFWDVSYLFDNLEEGGEEEMEKMDSNDDGDDDDMDDSDEEDAKKSSSKGGKKGLPKVSVKATASEAFFADL